MNVVESSGLGKRYGNAWALRECTLTIRQRLAIVPENPGPDD